MDHLEDRLLAEAGFVHGLARALVRDADLAEDVAQDVLAAALHQRAAPRNYRNWLTAVTRRFASAARRERQQRREREARAAHREPGDREARAAAQVRLHRTLCDAVLALPEPYRTTVTLRFLDGLPPRAIARQLQRNATSVRQHLHRGLAMLRQRLDAEHGDREGWQSAFAACGLGLGSAATTPTLLTVLAMKKFAAVAVLALGLGAWWLVAGDPDAAPQSNQDATASPNAGESRVRDHATVDAAESARPENTTPVRIEVRFAARVQDDAGRPLPGVTVRCWREHGEAIVMQTRADGVAEFAPEEGRGLLRIEAEGRPPMLQVVPRLVGEQHIVLAAGAALRGVLLVDGAPAPAGLCIELDSPAPPLPSDLPAPAERWLKANAYLPDCVARTDARGGFAFSGLPESWSGLLNLPWTHWVVLQPGQVGSHHARGLRVLAPQTDLVIVATQLPTIAGRVIWDDNGAAVAHPGVFGCVEFEDGANSIGISFDGDAAGRFAMGFYPSGASKQASFVDPARRSPMAKASLDVDAKGAAGRTHVDFDAQQLAGMRELVVRVKRAPVTHFLAVDERRGPVAGAKVQTKGTGGFSEPTGRDGRGTFAGPSDGLLVGAPGCQVMPGVPDSTTAGTVDDPLVFTLAKDNALAVRVCTSAGDPLAGMRVELRSPVLPYRGRRFQREIDREFGSAAAYGHANQLRQADGSLAIASALQHADTDTRGEVVLHSLEPGLQCTVVAFDALGLELGSKAVVTPAPGDTLEVDFVEDRTPRLLKGRVCRLDGAPLVSAKVMLSIANGSRTTRTDHRGEFAFTQIYTDLPVRLIASEVGYAPQQSEERLRERDGEPFEFRLPQGNRVRVTVRDPGDQIIPLRVAVETEVKPENAAQENAPGDFTFADLPPGEVRFVCVVHRERFELRHDTSQPEAVLRVPKLARIAIVPPVGLAAPTAGYHAALVTRRDLAEDPFEVSLSSKGEDPILLLPGRYRVQLVVAQWSKDQPEYSALGPAAEVDLGGGESVRVPLR